MSFVLEPFHLVLAILSGWVHRQQQETIDYLLTAFQSGGAGRPNLVALGG